VAHSLLASAVCFAENDDLFETLLDESLLKLIKIP
jgi:hypothetical protein